MKYTPRRQVYCAVNSGDIERTKKLFRKYPDLIEREGNILGSWLHDAAASGQIGMVEFLLNIGFDVNLSPDKAGTPLQHAIDFAQFEVAKYLLACGADANRGRTLIAAINREPDELALDFVKLLVKHGADVNRVFPWFDDDTVSFSPLSWAAFKGKKAIVEYLRSHGAIRPPEKSKKKRHVTINRRREVVDYFQRHFGRVNKEALIEIVPTEPAIAIHMVPPSSKRNHVTLFTTGMSEHAMNVPAGDERYQFAELFIQLPSDWPLSKQKMADPSFGWPIHWLRKVAKHPHEHHTWLCGPVGIIANGDPPKRLVPGVPFTCMLLLAEKDFKFNDGTAIQLYRLLPLFTEERDLEKREGSAALMRAFDEHSIPFVVDMKRANVAKT